MTGFCGGQNRKLYITTDQGVTWNSIYFPGSNQAIMDLQMVSPDFGYIVVGYSSFYKYDATTGFSETMEEPGYNVYPVPACEKIVIESTLGTDENLHLALFNAAGQCTGTYESNQNKVIIDISHLSAGIYILKISNGRFHTFEKVIKR